MCRIVEDLAEKEKQVLRLKKQKYLQSRICTKNRTCPESLQKQSSDLSYYVILINDNSKVLLQISPSKLYSA